MKITLRLTPFQRLVCAVVVGLAVFNLTAGAAHALGAGTWLAMAIGVLVGVEGGHIQWRILDRHTVKPPQNKRAI